MRANTRDPAIDAAWLLIIKAYASLAIGYETPNRLLQRTIFKHEWRVRTVALRIDDEAFNRPLAFVIKAVEDEEAAAGEDVEVL